MPPQSGMRQLLPLDLKMGQQLTDLNVPETIPNATAIGNDSYVGERALNRLVVAEQNINNLIDALVDQDPEIVDSVTKSIADNQAAITTVQTVATNNQQRVTRAEELISTNTNGIADNLEAITENTTNIATNTTNIRSNTQNIAQLNSGFENLGFRMDALGQQVSRNSHNIDANRAGVAIANALAGTTWLQANETHAFTGNWGYFDNSNAFAFTATQRLDQNWSVNGGIGFSTDEGEVGARAGFRLGW
ncbi:MAG: YadA C-terminal domain-containing protein [Pseudomonadota bacterium]